ncbi:uncharacterized protein LOC143136116 [Alosa pseudoharengus]|uniref:uncharacterized protein LOC143136116 n=1 Tax=Alosa pseudoharengus TaxID=34774 RepID=UPI003F89FF21
MHPQSYQETQQYQNHYDCSMNRNYYGLSVENPQLNGSQIPSSNLNQHANFGSSQYHHSLQHETCSPQTSYHGNGCHGTSLPNQNHVCPYEHSASASTSGPCNSFSGCSMPLGGSQNSQIVQSHQGAVVQPTHIPSSRTSQDWHPRNSPLTYLRHSTPQLQPESTHGWHLQNHSQSNGNGTVILNRGLQMLSGQLQATVKNLNVNRSSLPAQLQTLQLEHPSCQGVLQYLLLFPATNICCLKYQLYAIWQALFKRQNMQQFCKQGHVQMPVVNKCCRSCLYQVVRIISHKMKTIMTMTHHSKQQQYIQMNGVLSTKGHALKPLADGGKLKTCEDVPLKCGDDLPLLIKDIQPLAVEEVTEEAVTALDTDCSAMRKLSTSVKSSEDGSCPKDYFTGGQGTTHEEFVLYPSTESAICSSTLSAVCPNLDSLINLSPENKDTPKNQNNEELNQPDVLFDVPIVTFRLEMLRKLVASLDPKGEETKKDESSMNKNELDFAPSILDLYWDGSYHSYIEAEQGGTFANILKEAAEFDTDKDKKIFDSIKVEDLNQLQQKGHILTNCFDFDSATKVDTSSWRNISDNSLDIDKELADGSFPENCHEKSLERSLLNNLQNLGKNLGQDRISSKPEDHPSPTIIIDDQSDQDCSKTSDDPMLPTKIILLPPNELKPLPKQTYKDSDSACGVAAPSTCVDVNYSEMKLVPDNSVNSQDLDQKEVFPEDGCRLSENLSEEVETPNKDCPNSPDDSILSIKLPSVNEIKKVGLDNLYQDLVSSPQKDPPLPIILDKHSACLKSPADPALPMKITVLSMDEVKALSEEFCKDSDDGVQTVALSSPICLDSEDDDSEVNLGPTCQITRDLSQTSNQELIAILDGEEEIPSFTSIKDVLKQAKTSSKKRKQDDHLTKTTGKEPTNLLIDRRKGNEVQKPQQHLQKEYNHPKLSRWSSIHQKVSRKDSAHTAHQPAKPHGLETVANSSPCGIKASHPISPSAPIRKRKFSEMKESSSLDTVKGWEPGRLGANYGLESSSPTSILQSLPLKKRMRSLGEFGNSVKLTDIMVPSNHSPIKGTKTFSNSQDTGVDTELTDSNIHTDEAVGLPTTSEDIVLNLAGTLNVSELQKSSRGCKKRKPITLMLFGAHLEDLNRTTQHYTDCDRNIPIQLSIMHSLEKNSIKDKVRKSWEDCFVPTPGKSKRLSGPEGVYRKKNVHVRPVEHQKSQGAPGKDKEEQQSSAKEHQSEHRKHTKHISASLGS